MKIILISLFTLLSTSVMATETADFERGFNAGLKSCSEDSYYICSADSANAKLTMRSKSRGQAIKELYDYCYSPSRSVYRRDCDMITEQNYIKCIKL